MFLLSFDFFKENTKKNRQAEACPTKIILKTGAIH